MSSRPPLDVLIPVHNGEAELRLTLESLQTLKDRLKNEIQLTIRVGLNACSDRSKEVAESFQNVLILEFPEPSKWKTLEALVTASSAEWVCLMDVGTLADEEILKAFLKSKEVGVDAYFPSYGRYRSSVLERVHWKLESYFKKVEQFFGGPLSHHGATCFYKRQYVEDAFLELKKSEIPFYNDDVILPCAIKARHPSARFFYDTSLSIRDTQAPLDSKSSEAGRRVRMSFGNAQVFQWVFMVSSLPFLLKVLLLRRILRSLWAYFYLALAFLFFQLWGLLGALVIAYLVPQVSAAFQASLKAPVLFVSIFQNPRRELSNWK